MSPLIEGLERILKCFAAHEPHRVAQMGEGLKTKDIDELSASLPFKLPPEVYELYQWHNGSSDWCFLFENYEFRSLQRCIYAYREESLQIQQGYPELADMFQKRLPLFELWSEGGVFLTVEPDDKGSSPIYNYDISFKDYSLRYNSLTTLILHNAEWYETTIYHDGRWTLDHPSISHLLEYEIKAKYLARERLIARMDKGGHWEKLIYGKFLEQNP